MTVGDVRITGAEFVAPARAHYGVRLLEVDPELGRRLTGDQLTEAHQHARLTTVTLDPGHWELDRLKDHHAVRGELLGFLMLGGVLMIEVSIAGRACLRLIAPREVVLIDDLETEVLPAGWRIVVLGDAHLALLDDRLLAIATHWPLLLSTILQRAGQQIQHARLQQAISQLPRVEDRLLALLWSIADRQGVVRPDGVWVPLALTHETLAQMVGARRPTVSLGLRSLAERGVAHPEKDGWLIAHDSLKFLSSRSEELAAPGT